MATNKKRPGKPAAPGEFKERCQSLASRENTMQAVTAILNDPTHTQFMAALKWATEQGYGKPSQPVEHSGRIQHGVVVLPALRSA
jgi:hypothetical protein